MAFKKPELDKSKPKEGDLVMYNLGPDGLPALVEFGDVVVVHGGTFVVESEPLTGTTEPHKRLMNNGEARVVLSASERLRV